jgi:hypothetical protein
MYRGGSWRGGRGGGGNRMLNDWTCLVCGVPNFASRTECFRCNCYRPPSTQSRDSGVSSTIPGLAQGSNPRGSVGVANRGSRGNFGGRGRGLQQSLEQGARGGYGPAQGGIF